MPKQLYSSLRLLKRSALLHFAWVVDHEKCIVVTCVCVSVSVCLSVRGRMPTLLHGPACNLGSGRGCPLVVHYWVDLQSVHGLRRYGNTMEMQSPAVIRQAHRTPHACRIRTLHMPAKSPLTGDNMDAPAACAVPFCLYCGGVVTRARNVSDFMLVLALCLVISVGLWKVISKLVNNNSGVNTTFNLNAFIVWFKFRAPAFKYAALRSQVHE